MNNALRTQYLSFKTELEQTGKTYFSLSDLEKFYQHKKTSLKALLTHWKKQQLITKVGHGYYTLDLARVDYLQLATTLYPNSYVSFEYALYYYGMLNQVPTTVTLASLNRSRRFHLTAWTLEYTHIKKDLFFDYELKNNVYIATPEKALADTFYLIARGQRLVELDNLDRAKINKTKLQATLQQFPSYVQKLYQSFK
ncbi:MAG: hypothetical protein WCW27_04830 [Patescibacteria group bacterium]|jgi:predicted transcriptional regulator of viral defense system